MKPGAREFVFGMEPVEQVLYGETSPAPAIANAYLNAEARIEEIHSLHAAGNYRDLLKAASSLGESGYPLSIRQCLVLTIMLRAVVPGYPNPVLAFDLEPLGPLLQSMWNNAMKRDDERLQNHIASVYFRWFEHGKRYEDARRILAKTIENCRSHDDRGGEAYALNNFAFEYMLERRWQEAMPLFEAAAEAFRGQTHAVECANSRANYWLCRLECGDVIDLEEAEREVIELKDILCQSGSGWHARKPYVILARIEEARGNWAEAVRFAEQAVNCGQGSDTRYPEEDLRYLEHLKKTAKPELAHRGRS